MWRHLVNRDEGFGLEIHLYAARSPNLALDVRPLGTEISNQSTSVGFR